MDRGDPGGGAPSSNPTPAEPDVGDRRPSQQEAPHGVTPAMERYAIPVGEVVVPEVVDLARERLPYDPREIVAAYEAHQRELFGFALGATRSPEAAEDVVQEAFLRLIRERSEGRAPANTRAWLYRVCANLVVSGARRRSVAERFLPFLVDSDVVDGPEREYLRRDDQRHLASALAHLGPVERTALILASRGFSGREVAATIGKSETATRTLMSRARLKLRSQLEREGTA